MTPLISLMLSLRSNLLYYFRAKEPASEADTIKPSDFRAKILDSMVKSQPGDQDFLPDGVVAQLATEPLVRSLLPLASPSLVEFVCQRARKVFFTILWCRHGAEVDLVSIMNTFERFGMTDDNLPIDNIVGQGGTCKTHKKERCTHDEVLNVFHYDAWEPDAISRFYQDQWKFCPAVFKSNLRQELKANCILPFTWRSSDERDGHFSTVFEAKLHADQHQDDSGLRVGGQKEVHIAVKRLKCVLSEPGYNVETTWEREALALNQISELRHKHLIRRIAAFKRGTEHYIMFEWADGGTLRDVWLREGTERRNLDGDRIMGVLEQLLGLTGALSRLHNTNTRTKTAKATSATTKRANVGTGSKTGIILSPHADDGDTNAAAGSLRVPQVRFQLDSFDDDFYTSDDADDAREEHWRHGDLKPDNILQFKDSTWLGTLKIADLGLAKQHVFATSRRIEHTEQKYTTSQYEAPEVITNWNLRVPRSRRYDIWSMGCIVLEFTIWLLYGYDGLRTFYKEGDHIDTSTETLYFTVDKDERAARVSEISTSWMEQILHKDPECQSSSGSAIKDLVELVRNRLLVVALPKEGIKAQALEECRADAGELEIALNRIWIKARDDEGYLISGSSREGVQTPQPLGSRRKSFLSTYDHSSGATLQSRPRNLASFSDQLLRRIRLIGFRRYVRWPVEEPLKGLLTEWQFH